MDQGVTHDQTTINPSKRIDSDRPGSLRRQQRAARNKRRDNLACGKRTASAILRDHTDTGERISIAVLIPGICRVSVALSLAVSCT